MKKTFQTLMTAAVFASALTNGITDTLSASSYDEYPQPEYGPPQFEEDLDDSTTSTTTTTTTTTTRTEGTVTTAWETTTDYPQSEETTTTYTGTMLAGEIVTTTEVTLGGVAPIIEEGDLNADGSFDGRDVSLLKQYLLSGQARTVTEINGDINYDGSIDKDDVKALIRLLTGKPEEEDPDITTAISHNTDDVTSFTTTFATLYGPPPAYN